MSIRDSIGANRIVLALSIARLADAAGNSILFVIIPLYVADLSATWLPFPEIVRASMLISVYGLVNAAIQPFAGAMIDRFNHHKLFIQVGLILVGLSTLTFVIADKFIDLLLLRMLQGIGLGLTIPASMSLLASASRKQTRGGSMGIYTAFRLTGFSAGPTIGGYLYVYFSFNTAFYVATALIALAVVLVHVWINEAPAGSSIKEKHPFRIIDRQLLTAGIVGSSVAAFAMASAFSIVTPLEKQFNAHLHQTAFDFGISFSVLMLGRLLFQIPLGRLSDYLGRKPLIIGGLILMAPATALLGEVRTTLQLIELRAIQGIGAAGVAASTFALAADLSSTGSAGRQISITTMGFGLGIALGPLLAGLLALLSFKLPFLVIGMTLLVSAWIVYYYVPETVQRKTRFHDREQ